MAGGAKKNAGSKIQTTEGAHTGPTSWFLKKHRSRTVTHGITKIRRKDGVLGKSRRRHLKENEVE